MSSDTCDGCRSAEPFPINFSMAFQPIIDVQQQQIWGYEALVRGLAGEGAGTILSAVTPQNKYKFDQACRVKAIELAGTKMPADSMAKLSINFMPNAVYEPSACIRASLAAARRVRMTFDMGMYAPDEHAAKVGYDDAILQRLAALEAWRESVDNAFGQVEADEGQSLLDTQGAQISRMMTGEK